MHTPFRRNLLVALVLTAIVAPRLPADDVEEKPPEQTNGLATAVTLNYCRAAFHRIRKEPNSDVLIEEQEKILNNLNLSQLEDQEVITLYSSVLDEIGQIGLAEKERDLFQKHYKGAVSRQITWDALAFGTDLAIGQFGNAIRTGANSWWDYRTKIHQRDTDLLKVEKGRITTVMQRSSQFLDTFWKMARKKNIPDRWLVRGDDLDHLEAAMQEDDPQVRLRVLRRMETYMEAYPPYWYYMGRTNQELGRLTEAMENYSHLETLGGGHFRKDDMLSTAMANQAAIQDHLGHDRAVASARKSLQYSTDVWEANLIAARVLQRHGQVADAEDAILRNLDVNLEKKQSHVFLASLYYFTRDERKLAALLNKPEAVAHLPAPVLLRCAALVGFDKTPPEVRNNLLASLEAYPRPAFGGEQLLVRVGHAWQLHLARVQFYQGGEPLADPQVTAGEGYHDLRFAGRSDWGRSLASVPRGELRMELTYPDETVVMLVLRDQRRPGRGTSMGLTSAPSLRISDVRIGGKTVALHSREASLPGAQIHVQTSRPVLESSIVDDAPEAETTIETDAGLLVPLTPPDEEGDEEGAVLEAAP